MCCFATSNLPPPPAPSARPQITPASSTDEPYYHNASLHQTRWDSPAGPGGSEPPLPQGWRAGVHEETGIVFYTHRKTGRQVWVRPGEPEVEESSEAGDLAAALLSGEEDAW